MSTSKIYIHLCVMMNDVSTDKDPSGMNGPLCSQANCMRHEGAMRVWGNLDVDAKLKVFCEVKSMIETWHGLNAWLFTVLLALYSFFFLSRHHCNIVSSSPPLVVTTVMSLQRWP
jgi:hypothetical protein